MIFTHLYFDHVGWSTDGERPLFTAARHHAHAVDWAYATTSVPIPTRKPVPDARTSVRSPPRRACSRLLTRSSSTPSSATEIVPGVTLRLAPGHTPGHCIVEIDSRGERAVLLADAAHNPAQLEADDWRIAHSTWTPSSRSARARLLAAELADTGTLITMTHDAGNRFGRLDTAAGARRWTYAPSIE